MNNVVMNTHEFTTPINSKCCSICHPLAGISMSNYGLPIRPPVWGVRLDLMGRKLYQSKWSYPHSYLTSMHSIGLSCTVWPQCTTRQTIDRAIGIGRLCYSGQTAADRAKLCIERYWEAVGGLSIGAIADPLTLP